MDYNLGDYSDEEEVRVEVHNIAGENTRAETILNENTEADATENPEVEASESTEVSLEAHVTQLLLNTAEPLQNAGPVIHHTIFKPGVQMNEVDPQAFKPQLVSIGPYYLYMNSLRPMLKHKLRFYLRLLYKLYGSIDIHNNAIKTAVDNLLDRCKQCYSEAIPVNCSDSDFSLMMALDGCFIIELLRCYQTNQMDRDPLFWNRWMLPAIRVDLIKLGNQLPFFLLQELYDLTNSDGKPPLAQVAASFFAPLLRADKEHMSSADGNQDHEHLLALFHSTFKPFTANETYISMSFDKLLKRDEIVGVGSSSKLPYYGIKMKKRQTDLLNINITDFQSRLKLPTIEIPSLLIDPNTGSVLLNLVAHEQSSQSIPSYFTSYLVFLLGLVKSIKDVEDLRSCEIFKHELSISDEQVFSLLSNLAKGVALAHNVGVSYLSTTISTINTYKKSPWTSFKAKRLLLKMYILREPINFFLACYFIGLFIGSIPDIFFSHAIL